MLALVDDAPEMLPDVLLKGLLAEPLKGLLLNDELLNELLPNETLKKNVPGERPLELHQLLPLLNGLELHQLLLVPLNGGQTLRDSSGKCIEDA
jgi:hypothetical protein